ncbi:hypothetical protein Tdes44962_MAKER00185 [Teratosphaeria destructans]|uniref:Uncharacterized protein n=1 Tax=Teratosphaeria destructans TaxID=418781 RepID=A0A9W7SV03_9PEZI|nr:hypothetical protein Tdes44962_MAKER00185 [Teratosphaeria destructans]
MQFSLNPRRVSSTSTHSSQNSSTSSLEETLNATTLPLAPREDGYKLPEKTRQARMLAKCKQQHKQPAKHASQQSTSG